MVDDDENMIMQDERDSVRIGQYLIAEKIQFQNAEMEAEQGKNYDMKKKTRLQMIENNAHKHNGEDDRTHFKDANSKAIHNQARMPPENIRQELGFNPFDCDTISDVDNSLNLKDSVLDDDSLYQMDKSQHKKPGYGGRKLIDPDASINDSKVLNTQTHKKFNEMQNKKPEEKIGERMDKLYGPEDTKIKSILSKKVAEKMIK